MRTHDCAEEHHEGGSGNEPRVDVLLPAVVDEDPNGENVEQRGHACRREVLAGNKIRDTWVRTVQRALEKEGDELGLVKGKVHVDIRVHGVDVGMGGIEQKTSLYDGEKSYRRRSRLL